MASDPKRNAHYDLMRSLHNTAAPDTEIKTFKDSGKGAISVTILVLAHRMVY